MTAQLEAAKKAAAKREAAEAATGTASIELTERYVARPADLLSCFTEAQRVMAFTQAPAQVRRHAHLAVHTSPVLFASSCSGSTAHGGLLGPMVIKEAINWGTTRNGLIASLCLPPCAGPFPRLTGCLMSLSTTFASL